PRRHYLRSGWRGTRRPRQYRRPVHQAAAQGRRLGRAPRAARRAADRNAVTHRNFELPQMTNRKSVLALAALALNAVAAQPGGWTDAVEVRHDDDLCISYQA